MYFDAPKPQEATLFINGDVKGNYFDDYSWSVREGGYYTPGEEVSIRFDLDSDTLEIDNAYFYYESKQVLKAWYKDAVSTHVNISKITSSHLTARANVADTAEYLVFTIPYEDNWIVKVDGKKVKPVKVLDALLAVKTSPGEHELDLKYIPKGLVVGGPISLLSLIAAFCVLFLKKSVDKA